MSKNKDMLRKRKKKQEQRHSRQRQKVRPTRTGQMAGLDLDRLKELHAEGFRKRFGRDPTPDDPMQWDPDAPGDEPVPMPFIRHCVETFQFLEMAKFPRRMLYAYAYTGFMNHPRATGRTDIPEADVVEFEQRVEEFVEMDPDEQEAAIDRARKRVEERGAGPSPEEMAGRAEMAEEAAIIDEDDVYYQFSIDWLRQARVQDARGGDDPATSLGMACREVALQEFGADFDEDEFHDAFTAALTKMLTDHMTGGKGPAEG